MILLNDFQQQWQDTQERAIEAFRSVGESGWYILGKRLGEFEESLARLWGMRYAVGVASGMDALEISLRILGCRSGEKVLTTPLSAFATTLAILKLGATPVFVDTDEFGLIDLQACRRVLAARHDIRFCVPVHLYGNSVDLNELCRLQDEFGLGIVEDCAQSILAAFNGRPTGSVGKLAATSFYPTKNLGAMGDGGAILSGNEAFQQAARALRDYGQSSKYHHVQIGYNSRLDELHAAILRNAYLPELQRWTARRREIARCYLDGITHPGISCLGSPAGSQSCWHLFPVLVKPERKGSFMAHLQASGVCCGEHYPTLIPDQPAMAGQQFEVIGNCENASRISSSETSLPIHPYLTAEQVARVIEICNAWER
jgi:dTDP-3-amino-3,4,6-trideoxy-alpha-D-glucose transaminase